MNKEIEFLKSLQTKLKYQSEHENDCQASPRFWVVGDYKMSPCPHGYEDEVYIICPDREYNGNLGDLLEQIKQEIHEDEDGYTIEAKMFFHDIDDDESAFEWVRDYYDPNSYLVPVREDFFIVENTMFLTKEEVKKHLKQNRHHYTKKAHTYAMTAWRSPEAEQLFNILENFDWDSINNI